MVELVENFLALHNHYSLGLIDVCSQIASNCAICLTHDRDYQIEKDDGHDSGVGQPYNPGEVHHEQLAVELQVQVGIIGIYLNEPIFVINCKVMKCIPQRKDHPLDGWKQKGILIVEFNLKNHVYSREQDIDHQRHYEEWFQIFDQLWKQEHHEAHFFVYPHQEQQFDKGLKHHYRVEQFQSYLVVCNGSFSFIPTGEGATQYKGNRVNRHAGDVVDIPKVVEVITQLGFVDGYLHQFTNKE